jgi:hypothetical protein
MQLPYLITIAFRWGYLGYLNRFGDDWFTPTFRGQSKELVPFSG